MKQRQFYRWYSLAFRQWSWIWVLSISVWTGCRPAEKKSLKIPPVPANEQVVLQTSLAALSDAIDDEPQNSEYYFRRAYLYEQSKRYEDALSDINQAIENRRTGQAYGQYYILRGRVYLHQNKIDSAYKDAIQTEKLGAQSAEAYLLRGQMYAIKKQYKDAELSLRIAQQMTPYEPQIYYWQANTVAGSGDTVKAISLLHTALSYNHEPVPVYNRLAELHAGLWEWQTAKSYAFAGLKLDPENVVLNNNMGRFYRANRQIDSALIFYGHSLAKDTSQYQLMYEVGTMHMNRRSYWMALPYFEKLLAHIDQFPAIPELLAACYEFTGQQNARLTRWKQVIEADSTNLTAQRVYNTLFRRIQARRRQAAEDTLRKRQLIELKPIDIK